jgi:hypothetical protein
VIDRFFETKEKALAWERAHPNFMTVRVVSGRSAPRFHPEPLDQGQPNIERVAQTINPPPIAQADAPPPAPQAGALPPVAVVQDDAAAAIAFRLPWRSLVIAPPSYHRRRFAADAKENTEVPPPDWPIRRTKRSAA